MWKSQTTSAKGGDAQINLTRRTQCEQTFHRQYGVMKVEETKRLNELEVGLDPKRHRFVFENEA
jgi:hypothetical protein